MVNHLTILEILPAIRTVWLVPQNIMASVVSIIYQSSYFDIATYGYMNNT